LTSQVYKTVSFKLLRNINMKNIIFLSHLASLLALVLFTTHVQAELNIANSAEETKPMMAGEMAPDFTVYNVDGSAYHFDADKLERTTVLITFRGGWCPYCNTQLQELRNVLPDIKQSGVDVLFLSGDRPEILYSNLKQETQESIAMLDYTILSDAKLEASMALGLAFKMPDNTLDRFRKRSRDIDDSSIALHNALPIPAVYVITTDGNIAFAYTNPDFKVRLPAAKVKAAVDRVMSR
jgi:peroxiredoxin